VLIDSTHRIWFQVTAGIALVAVGGYAWAYVVTPGGLTGGTSLGLWYGVIGTLLMVYAGLLSVVRRVSRHWWIWPRQTWLRGHIWLGSLSGIFILCHSGFRWGGLIEIILWALLLGTLATGVLGLVFQWAFPTLLTLRIPSEIPYEQIPHVCDRLRLEAEVAAAAVEHDAGVDEQIRQEFARFFKDDVRPFLGPQFRRSAALGHPRRLQEVFGRVLGQQGLKPVAGRIEELRDYCEQRRQLGEQERLHHWLHGWLVVHVSLSILLLVFSAAHIVMSLWY
jgi:hypothetical protein